nr:MAG TPA: hypothetical protein [Caudoviricetes sp.]
MFRKSPYFVRLSDTFFTKYSILLNVEKKKPQCVKFLKTLKAIDS